MDPTHFLLFGLAFNILSEVHKNPTWRAIYGTGSMIAMVIYAIFLFKNL